MRLAECYYWLGVETSEEDSKEICFEKAQSILERSDRHPLTSLLLAKLKIDNRTCTKQEDIPDLILQSIYQGYTYLVTSMYTTRRKLLIDHVMQAATYFDPGALNEAGQLLMKEKSDFKLDTACGMKLTVLSHLYGSKQASANLIVHIRKLQCDNPNSLREFLPYIIDASYELSLDELCQKAIIELCSHARESTNRAPLIYVRQIYNESDDKQSAEVCYQRALAFSAGHDQQQEVKSLLKDLKKVTTLYNQFFLQQSLLK